LIKKVKVSKCKEVVKSIVDQNRKKIEQSLNEYYGNLNKIIAEAEKKAQSMLRTALKAQQQTTSYYNVWF